MLNTKNLWFNVIITHTKFNSSPFISSFSTIIPIFSPSIETTQVNIPLKYTHADHVNQYQNHEF